MKINLCFAVLIHPTEESLLIWPVDPFPPRDQWLLFKERCTTHTPRRPTSRNHLHSVTRSLHSAIISFRGTVEACEWDGAGSRGGGRYQWLPELTDVGLACLGADATCVTLRNGNTILEKKKWIGKTNPRPKKLGISSLQLPCRYVPYKTAFIWGAVGVLGFRLQITYNVERSGDTRFPLAPNSTGGVLICFFQLTGLNCFLPFNVSLP